MRRRQRREDARRERKRAARRARWHAVRIMRETEGAPERAVTRWPFACASVCGRCGALALPTSTRDGDPMRRDAEPAKPTRCEHCDATTATLIDLSSRDMATALVDAEVHDRKVHADRHRVIGGPLAQTVLLSALAAVAFLGAAPVAGATLVAATLQRGATTVQRISARSKTPSHARRWSHRAKPGTPVKQFEGAATGQPRHAPLTGKACVAYDVRVVWSGESPHDVRALALHEQSTDTLHVDTHDASAAYVQLEPRKLSSQEVLKSPHAVEFLASRGLQPCDGPFDYYESVIEKQQTVVTTRDAEGRMGVHV